MPRVRTYQCWTHRRRLRPGRNRRPLHAARRRRLGFAKGPFGRVRQQVGQAGLQRRLVPGPQVAQEHLERGPGRGTCTAPGLRALGAVQKFDDGPLRPRRPRALRRRHLRVGRRLPRRRLALARHPAALPAAAAGENAEPDPKGPQTTLRRRRPPPQEARRGYALPPPRTGSRRRYATRQDFCGQARQAGRHLHRHRRLLRQRGEEAPRPRRGLWGQSALPRHGDADGDSEYHRGLDRRDG
mmetsp:Transcript_21439/g.72662  ORF Transcript_21439/g.72662 Transcript_21439/m.72662 type:complete len:241 (-) Transcript_21439:77-799(-)